MEESRLAVTLYAVLPRFRPEVLIFAKVRVFVIVAAVALPTNYVSRQPLLTVLVNINDAAVAVAVW